jgi:hypothetical protein
MKKIFIFLSLLFLFIPRVFAEEEKIEFSIFSRSDCVHCIELTNFLETYKADFTGAVAKYYDIDEKENRYLLSIFK